MPNYLHVSRGLLNGTYGWSVRMYSTSTVAEAAAEASWHAAFKTFWNTAAVRALYPATCSWTSTTSYTQSGTWRSTTGTTTSEVIAGTGAQAQAYECVVLATLRTAFKNRTGIGRWYLPGLTTAGLAVNGWTYLPASITTIATALGTMNAAWAGTLTPVILHRRLLTTDNIIHADVPDQVYVQRRRGHKRIPARTVAW